MRKYLIVWIRAEVENKRLIRHLVRKRTESGVKGGFFRQLGRMWPGKSLSYAEGGRSAGEEKPSLAAGLLDGRGAPD
jgi:hypothetical protein